ncbi:serine/threonine-protein kinase [Nocardia sp. NPDC049149]|uniref:serine/threonine-protein kinase n=1 Tax=Nocardia sp. NPDC049149 TaxID=3364315 RepID=UPI003716238A
MEFLPGHRFAGFIVQARLGDGGSSVVYLAEDPEAERHVALKIMCEEESRSPAARARFVHEFDVLDTLRHPDIVRMYAHGESGGMLWSAHEYVAGTSGTALVPQKLPDLRRVLRMLTHTAAGLDYAHANNVVHLDVKPGNVLVGTGEPAIVKVSDFDQARWLDRPEPPLATDGFVVVSLSYAAPELLRAGTVSPATDQYALACTAVELLTGHPPYRRANLLAIAQAHLHDQPPRIAEQHRWMPPEVDTILHRSLAKDPGARYSSCAEPIRLLSEALAGHEPFPDSALFQLRTTLSRLPLLRRRHAATPRIAVPRPGEHPGQPSHQP